MDCKRAQLLLNAYVDGELDLSGSLELEGHLAGCAQCRSLREQLGSLGRRLKGTLERHPAPPHVKERLAAALASQSLPASVPLQGRTVSAAARTWPRRQIYALAASVLMAAVVSGGGTYWAMRPPAGELIADEVVASHIRSLMADHLIDVASSDQHTVKPWFDGRLDLAPAVLDLSKQGFPLVGGRLDYIGGQPVAAIVYRRGKHTINLFAWPSGELPAAGASRPLAIRGYNLRAFTVADMTYWAVSDVNPRDLDTLEHLIEQGAGATPD